MSVLASVVISTYNRASALPATLDALAHQDVPPEDYEVLVVDDGSSDETDHVLSRTTAPYRLRTFRLPANAGVSAGRNVGLRHAEGKYIIMISDDLIVPREFISTHVRTLERFPGRWVVGGFTQLESLTDTPFGRFLDALERSFEKARLGRKIEERVYEMKMPTARNLSLPRSDLERVGLFDERFRVTCEDQDLAHRAAQQGVSFIYNTALECIHNDQAADLKRYCLFQERGSRDTALLCAKYPQLHSRSAVARVNGYVARSDGPALVIRKLVKHALSLVPVTIALEHVTRFAERIHVPDRWLARGYRVLIGAYTFRGFRTGLRELRAQHAPR